MTDYRETTGKKGEDVLQTGIPLVEAPDGGGGTDGGDDSTDDDDDSGGSSGGGSSTPDVSIVNITSFSASETGEGEATMSFTVENEVFSGSGETLAPTISIKVDGNQVDTVATTLGPAQSETMEVVLSELSDGDRTLCADIK